MRKRNLASIAMVGLLLVTLVVPLSASATPCGEPFTAVCMEGPQNQLEFGSDILVFKSAPNCETSDDFSWDVLGHDLASGQTFVISDSEWTENNPSIYGDIAVWMGENEDGEDDIWGKNLSTGVSFPICTREGDQCNPFVWGDWVVFVDQANANGSDYALCKYNLKTGVTSLVNDSEYDQYCPAQNGTYAAYRTYTSHTEIWATNLATGMTSVCETNTNQKYEVSMGNENIVVWDEYIDGHRRPVAYDINTGIRSVLGTDTGSADNPDVYGDIVVWADSRNYATTGYDIYMYDLSTGVETTVCAAPGDQERPRIWEDTIAWVGCGSATGTQRDIFAVRLDMIEYKVEGTDRYTTACNASRHAFPGGADSVVIASGETWPDALSASALAGAVNGPVLLTESGKLPAQTAAEIARLGAKNVYVVGGTSVVSRNVENALNATVRGPVARLGGEDRYETAEIISAKTVRLLGDDYDGTAFLATAKDYADSLAAAPLAAAKGWPIYLSDPSAIRPSTTTAMTRAGVKKVAILGGTAAISSATETLLGSRALTSTSTVETKRLAGANRFSTAITIAQYGVDNGMNWDGLALTNAYNFPDALAGGPLQGISGSVVLLTSTTSLNSETAAKINAEKDSISNVKYLGGVNAITQSVRDSVDAILK